MIICTYSLYIIVDIYCSLPHEMDIIHLPVINFCISMPINFNNKELIQRFAKICNVLMIYDLSPTIVYFL